MIDLYVDYDFLLRNDMIKELDTIVIHDESGEREDIIYNREKKDDVLHGEPDKYGYYF